MKLKKKIVSMLLAVVLFVSLFSGCGNGSDNAKYYGDDVSNDTLRICIDCASFDSSLSMDREYIVGNFLKDLVGKIKSACGIEQIVFEVLPEAGAERRTALQRLRTEIMAGGGPDVFIMDTSRDLSEIEVSMGLDNRSSLFIYPEKNMEAGLFLPLDEYMENNSQFTDWNLQTKAVMDAGRNDEGQVVIPLTYTLPVFVYPKNAVAPSISKMTMWEILENTETAELGAVLYSSKRRTDDTGSRINRSNLPFILGRLADYKTEELLFTKEELYTVIEAGIVLQDEIEKNEIVYLESAADYDLIYQLNLEFFEEEMTLVPLYSIHGGVTASIRSYTAVNRNTKFPEEAFSVIDYIMQEDMQRNSDFYNRYYIDGLPMQNDLGQQGKSLRSTTMPERILTEPYFEELLAIKSQISSVNFLSGLDSALDNALSDIQFDISTSNSSLEKEKVSEVYEKMERMMAE